MCTIMPEGINEYCRVSVLCACGVFGFARRQQAENSQANERTTTTNYAWLPRASARWQGCTSWRSVLGEKTAVGAASVRCEGCKCTFRGYTCPACGNWDQQKQHQQQRDGPDAAACTRARQRLAPQCRACGHQPPADAEEGGWPPPSSTPRCTADVGDTGVPQMDAPCEPTADGESDPPVVSAAEEVTPMFQAVGSEVGGHLPRGDPPLWKNAGKAEGQAASAVTAVLAGKRKNKTKNISSSHPMDGSGTGGGCGGHGIGGKEEEPYFGLPLAQHAVAHNDTESTKPPVNFQEPEEDNSKAAAADGPLSEPTETSCSTTPSGKRGVAATSIHSSGGFCSVVPPNDDDGKTSPPEASSRGPVPVAPRAPPPRGRPKRSGRRPSHQRRASRSPATTTEEVGAEASSAEGADISGSSVVDRESPRCTARAATDGANNAAAKHSWPARPQSQKRGSNGAAAEEEGGQEGGEAIQGSSGGHPAVASDDTLEFVTAFGGGSGGGGDGDEAKNSALGNPSETPETTEDVINATMDTKHRLPYEEVASSAGSPSTTTTAVQNRHSRGGKIKGAGAGTGRGGRRRRSRSASAPLATTTAKTANGEGVRQFHDTITEGSGGNQVKEDGNNDYCNGINGLPADRGNKNNKNNRGGQSEERGGVTNVSL